MKKTILTFLFAVIAMLFVTSCGSGEKTKEFNTSNVQLPQSDRTAVTLKDDYSDQLDWEGISAVAAQSKTIAELEQALNKPASEGGVNNLDIDKDGQVDRIAVNQDKDDTTILQLTAITGDGDKYDIGQIQFKQNGDGNIGMTAVPNEQYFANSQPVGYNNMNCSTCAGGHGGHSVGHDILEAYLWMHILTRPPLYVSPFYGIGYPGWYRPYGAVSVGVYRSSVTTVTRNVSSRPTRYSRNSSNGPRYNSSVAKRANAVAPQKSKLATQGRDRKNAGMGANRNSVGSGKVLTRDQMRQRREQSAQQRNNGVGRTNNGGSGNRVTPRNNGGGSSYNRPSSGGRSYTPPSRPSRPASRPSGGGRRGGRR